MPPDKNTQQHYAIAKLHEAAKGIRQAFNELPVLRKRLDRCRENKSRAREVYSELQQQRSRLLAALNTAALALQEMELSDVSDYGDVALDGLLSHIQGHAVVLDGVMLGLRADLIAGVVQQVALGRGDFPDGPIITADIGAGGKLACGVGGVGVHQLATLEYAVVVYPNNK